MPVRISRPGQPLHETVQRTPLQSHTQASTRKGVAMTDSVRNNKTENRYELEVDGHLAATYYKISGNVITFVHTEVPNELAGQGVGSRLVRGALMAVRAEGQKVVPQCAF